jgi:undecaprenyl diphosphate synthase
MHIDVQCYEGRSLDTVTQTETLDPLGDAHRPRLPETYTAATAVLETCDRLTEEREPALQQFLLLAWRPVLPGRPRAHDPNLVLDAYLLRALADRRLWAPSFHDCAKCGAPGPHPAFHVVGGGSVCPLLSSTGIGRSGPRDPAVCSRRCSPATGPSPTPRILRHRREGSRPDRSLPAVAHRTRPAKHSVWWSGDRRAPPSRYAAPFPHPSGARPPPVIASDRMPRHVAVVMDGNGRWANQSAACRAPRGTRPARRHCSTSSPEPSRSGVTHLSAYAFSTENWKRSPEEVRFLMGFNRDVIRRRRDQLHAWGVRMRWVGRRPRLWGSVIKELEIAQELTKHNTGLTLYFCVNYGGRAEIGDAARAIAQDVARGRLKASAVDERTLARYLPEPGMPDVDLFVRSSGEQRTSNFLLWQSAYAEMVFQDRLWPDYDRRDLWSAIEEYVHRERRMGGAVDMPRTETHQ